MEREAKEKEERRSKVKEREERRAKEREEKEGEERRTREREERRAKEREEKEREERKAKEREARRQERRQRDKAIEEERQAEERCRRASEDEARRRAARQQQEDLSRQVRFLSQRSRSPCFDELGRRRRGCQFGGLNLILADPLLDPRPFMCFVCWGTNHRHDGCPSKHCYPGLRYCYNCGRRHRTVATCERCKDAHARHQMSLGRPDPRLIAELNSAGSGSAGQSAQEKQTDCLGEGWFNGEQVRRQQNQEFFYNTWLESLESQALAQRITVQPTHNTFVQPRNETVVEPLQEVTYSGSAGPMETEVIQAPAGPIEPVLGISNEPVPPGPMQHVVQPESLQQFASLSQQPPDPVVTILRSLPFARNEEERQQLMDYAVRLAIGRP